MILKAIKAIKASKAVKTRLRFSKRQTRAPATSRLAKPNAGGVALEYIMVTTFALATTLAALGYLGKTMKSRFAELEATSVRTASGDAMWDP